MKAKIYHPAKTAMQSGKGNTKNWLLKFIPENTRSIDSLMGWTSNSDTKQQLTIKFNSLEDAEKYAKSRNIEYVIVPPHSPKLIIQSYAGNFIGTKI